MRTRRRIAGAVFLAAAITGPAGAETLLSGPEFRAATEGYTLYFEDEFGDYFGAEQYLPGQESIWLPRGGQCLPGVWSEDRGRICFLHYDEVACWRIYGENGGVSSAVAADEGDAPLQLRIIRRDKTPIICPDGPGV